MLLIEKDISKTRFPLPAFDRYEQVEVHLGVPLDDEIWHFNIEGEVVRTLTTGIGVNFPYGIDSNLLDALLQYSGIAPISATPSLSARQTTAGLKLDLDKFSPIGRYPQKKNSQASILRKSLLVENGNASVNELTKFLSELRQLVSKIIPEMMYVFFEKMDGEMLNMARKAETPYEQSDIFTALTELRSRRNEISRSFSREILNKIDDPRDMDALVEDYRRLMRHKEVGKYLSDRDRLLRTREFENWLAFVNAIEHGQREYEKQLQEIQARLGKLVESWGYNEGNPLGVFVFCHAFGNAVRSLELNQALREEAYSGLEKVIMPLMRKLYMSVLKSIDVNWIFSGPETGPLGLHSLEDQLESELLNETDTSEPASDLEKNSDGNCDRDSEKESDNKVSVSGEKSRNKSSAPERIVSLENLIDTLEEDFPLSEKSRDWIRCLKDIPRDLTPTLAKDNPQEVLAVIDQLVILGEGESSMLKLSVDELMDEIVNRHQNDDLIFLEAQQKLKPLVEKHNQIYSANIQRTISASEGHQALTEAQTKLTEELSQFLEGKQVSELFLKFLVPGWRNLLISTFLRKGKDSQDWSRYIRVLHQVYAYLNPHQDPSLSSGYMTPLDLITEVEVGLASIAYESAQSAPLLKSLHQMFSQRQVGNDAAFREILLIEIEPGSMAQILGFGDIEEKRLRRLELKRFQADQSEWDKCFDSIRNMQLEDKIELKKDSGKSEVVILGWFNSSKSSMIFVNYLGVKACEWSVEELANQLVEGEAILVEDPGLSISLKAIQRHLKNSHGQLLLKTERDELTGLVNGKKIKRILRDAVVQAKREGCRFLFALFEIDQTESIVYDSDSDNGSVDSLIKDVTDTLVDGLGLDKSIVLSRFDDRKFAFLQKLNNNIAGDQDQTKQVFDELSALISAGKCSQDKQSFLTISAGMILIDEKTAVSETLLEDVESAWAIAHGKGPASLYIYQADQKKLDFRQQIAKTDAWVDGALEKNEIKLECQKIFSADPENNKSPFYEVICSFPKNRSTPLEVEMPTKVPAEDFVASAVGTNRAVRIDEWAVKNSFSWIADNQDKLDPESLFWIKLSTDSLLENGFTEFILRQFNETGLRTSLVCFEVPMASASTGLENLMNFMECLKTVGVRFSVGNIGADPAFFSRLKKLPLDYAKIDEFFVRDIKDNNCDYAVVRSVNESCHMLGIKTMAEIVEDGEDGEDGEIFQILRDTGVDYVQRIGMDGVLQDSSPFNNLVSKGTSG